MERRIFLAVFLSFVVVYAYQALFVPKEPPRSEPPAATQTAQPAPQEQARDVAPAPAAATSSAGKPVLSEAAEREIVIEAPTVRAVFTNRGGRIKHWLLKEYAQDATGSPVDLVPSKIPADLPLPFSLRVDEDGLTPTLNNSLYRATQSGNDLTFDYEDSTGLRVRKRFQLDLQRYLIRFTADVRQGDRVFNPYVQWGPGLGDIGAATAGGSFLRANYIQPPQAIYSEGGRNVYRVAATDVNSSPVHEGAFRFEGVDDHYFIASAINPGPARVEYRAVTLPAVDAPDVPDQQRQLVAHTYRFANPPTDVTFFFGPKAFDVLKSVDPEFIWAIHFGVFQVIAVPLLNALKSIYGMIGNYGWAIVLLTVFINLAISPLRHWSVVSMRKMQAIQPQIKAIQDRYADLKITDPQRQKMNTEVMNLYREKGVNPTTGCLPMLFTIPVLFAFYSFLSVAIELRGAQFTLWIHDLSRPDPYYVTPILMAATMFWQQKITPTSADPAQQRIMLIMPLMFSVMFLSAPSGLVLYWFVSNLWAIGQQYFTNWWLGPMPAPPRPAAERVMKPAGAGKTAKARK
jgi:YidC/Oxa1 family membrane protein insertase